MITDPLSYYQECRQVVADKITAAKKTSNLFSLFRVLVFFGILVLIYLLTGTSLSGLIVAGTVGLAVFVLLVRIHLRHSEHIRHLENLQTIYDAEILSLQGDFSGFYDGSDFIDHDHPFSADLDLFGRSSVFQYLNRTSTHPGAEQLARTLSGTELDREVILKRQQAISELSQKPEWCREFLATAADVEERPTDATELLNWIAAPPKFDKPMIMVWLVLAPLVAFGTVTLTALKIFPSVALLLPFMFSYTILSRYIKQININHRDLGNKSRIMRKYARLLEQIEAHNFHSPYLDRLKAALKSDRMKPSRDVRHLSRILQAFDNRLNLIMGLLLNLFLLWDIIQAKRAEKWVTRHKDSLPEWIGVIAQMDALISLATFRFNHPRAIFPEIKGGGVCIEGEGLGHPLIPNEKCVTNPAEITGTGQIHIITGANMAGKSTYLRTVGVNLLLALTGAPVLAESFACCPVRMITSIKTSDSLQNNESYFYVELKHLQHIITALEAGETLFVLLDEILKGTNSRDKQQGSVALIRKLLSYKVSGLVATHDLSLGELEKEFPGRVVNRSFEVVIKDDKLVFDYLLKQGVARQMNATFLMRKMGITD